MTTLPPHLLGLLDAFFDGPSEADLRASDARVAALREATGSDDADALVRAATARAATRCAAVGAATTGAALVPGFGTAAAVAMGAVADVGATLRLQTELVLDIAALRGVRLQGPEARTAVLVVAGASTAGSLVARRAGHEAVRRWAGRLTARSLLRAVPVAGLVLVSGANAVATHLIGRRADAYFTLGPEAMGDWRASLRAVTGLDTRRLRLPRLSLRLPRRATT